MRLSHLEVGQFLADPTGWMTSRGEGRSVFRLGYAQATKLAIYRFHRSGSEVEAVAHLEGLIDRAGLTSLTRALQAEDALRAYIAWSRASRPVTAATRLRVDLELAPGWTMGGEVSRVDVGSRNYRAVLLGVGSTALGSEIRMPLLQRAVATRLQRPEAEVEIGVQAIDGADLSTRSFDTAAIDVACLSIRSAIEGLRVAAVHPSMRSR